MILTWPKNNKTKVLAEFRRHIELDELVAGTYGNYVNGKHIACAVGCLTGGNNHNLYPELYGIPVQLAYLHDAIFEGLSKTDAKVGQQWSYRFLEVIQEHADLSIKFSEITVLLFEDQQHGLLKLYPDNEHKSSLVQVVDLHKRIIAGGIVTKDEWRAAADAAYAADAAAYVAYAAARAAYAAAAAADAAAYAAYAAARAARAAYAAAYAAYAADAAAYAEFWQWLSEQLLVLLANAPVVESTPRHRSPVARVGRVARADYRSEVIKRK